MDQLHLLVSTGARRRRCWASASKTSVLVAWAILAAACSRTPDRRSTAPPPIPPASPSAVSTVPPPSASVAEPTPTASGSTAAASAKDTAAQPSSATRVPDVVYVPSPQNVVDLMLQAAEVKATDVVYDLGCGDGRILVTAARKYGAKGVGFDIDPQRVKEARDNVKKSGVEQLVRIEQQDIFEVDLSPATVVTLYLLPSLNVKLIPQLEKLSPGSRIVSHDFPMEGVPSDRKWTIIAPDHNYPKKNRDHYVYLWKAPIRSRASK